MQLSSQQMQAGIMRCATPGLPRAVPAHRPIHHIPANPQQNPGKQAGQVLSPVLWLEKQAWSFSYRLSSCSWRLVRRALTSCLHSLPASLTLQRLLASRSAPGCRPQGRSSAGQELQLGRAKRVSAPSSSDGQLALCLQTPFTDPHPPRELVMRSLGTILPYDQMQKRRSFSS